METWLGIIGLNRGKFSFKVMIFIPISECSHIIGVTVRSQGIEKTPKSWKTRWCNGIKRKWRGNYIHVKRNNNCGLHL